MTAHPPPGPAFVRTPATPPPRPRLPTDARTVALVAGAIGGAAIGIGLSLANLATLVLVGLALLGSGVVALSIMWGMPDDLPVDELLVELALPLGIAGALGLVLVAAGCVGAWLQLRRRVPRAAGVAAAGCAITAAGIAALSLITTAIAWPALSTLGGGAAVPTAIGLAVALGLVGAPIGALVLWWMTAAMRAREIAGIGPATTT